MTESDWLASTDPAAMLAYLNSTTRGDGASAANRRPSDRKLRLFAIAVARHGGCGTWAIESVGRLLKAAYCCADGIPHDLTPREVADGQQYVASWLIVSDASEVARLILNHYAADVEDRAAGPAQAAILREIAGNPFREIDASSLRSWQEMHARFRPIAQAAYDGRRENGTLDPQRLLILSDVLEDAGCTEEAILRHLRGDDYTFQRYRRVWRKATAPHVCGCWCLDILLGKC